MPRNRGGQEQERLFPEQPERRGLDFADLHPAEDKPFTGISLRAHWFRPEHRQLIDQFRAAMPANLSQRDETRGGRDSRTENEVFLSNLHVYAAQQQGTQEISTYLGIEYGFQLQKQLPPEVKAIPTPPGKKLLLLPAVKAADLVGKEDARREKIDAELKSVFKV